MSGLDPDSINWFVPKVALILALEAEVNAPADTNLSLIWAEADTIPASKALIAKLDKEPDISSAICANYILSSRCSYYSFSKVRCSKSVIRNVCKRSRFSIWWWMF